MAAGKSEYHSDRYTTEDQLNFNDFCPTLSRILLKADTPLTVGVFGPWGSGKTSLLQMLKNEVEEEQEEGGQKPRPRTVWFTAWKYEKHEALWRAFILRVLDALYPRQEGDESQRLTVEDSADPSEIELIQKLNRLEESVYRPVDWRELGR